ncbi:beta-defensin 135 [Suricata suricatta]|uniref:Beta-defensin n=1 Tax=Suricata suricatta TaxID=37032 RepID=A0A673U579_SURSU|nr:beta-defensin 135 [Suricata suricatta]
MKSSLLVLVVLVLLSCVPPVRSGPNPYIRKAFSTCWKGKGTCRKLCWTNEEHRILCDVAQLCCVKKKMLQVEFTR